MNDSTWSDWQDLEGKTWNLIRVGSNADGRLELFAFGATPDGSGTTGLLHQWQLSPGGDWSGWQPLSGPSAIDSTALAVGQNLDGRLEVFGNSPLESAVKHVYQTQPNKAWSQWESLGGPKDTQFTGLEVARNQDGRLEVFGFAGDFTIWHNSQRKPNSDWSGWNIINGSPGSTPSAAIELDSGGHLQLFIVAWKNGQNIGLWNASQADGWAWKRLDTTTLPSQVHGLAGGRNQDGRLELFAVVGGEMWHSYQRPGSGRQMVWSGWFNLGRPKNEQFAGKPSAILNQHGSLQVFVVAQSRSVWTITQAPGTVTGWNHWAPLGTPNGDPVTMITALNRNGRLEVFTGQKSGGTAYIREVTESRLRSFNGLLTDVLSISASADGLVWAVDKSHQVFKHDASTDQWQQVPGELSNIAVGSASNIWGVSADGKVWKYDGDGQSWKPVPGPAGSPLVQISASSDGQVWAVSADGKVWKHVGGSESWQKIPASRAKYVSVGSVDNIWSVDVEMLVWFYHPSPNVDIPWAPVIEGKLAQVSARPPRPRFAGEPVDSLDAAAWAVNADGEVFRYNLNYPFSRQKMGSGYKQISVGSSGNAWAIDMNDTAICLTPPQPEIGMGGEPWIASEQKRWDSKDKYDQLQSTHLWIVTRAAEVAHADPIFGNKVFNLVQPGASRGTSEFHDALAEGLWDADAADPYRNTVFGADILATYKSHFYDPKTGRNWRGESDPTALTEGPKFFAEAARQYKNGNIRAAGYNLGLSLHYLTDMTQPMHTTNYTWLSSLPVGYHTAFEGFAIEAMKEVQITQPYVPSKLGTDPALYIKAAAMKSRPRGDTITSIFALSAWKSQTYNHFFPWRDRVKPEIRDALIDGVAITAQYLIAWMQTALPTVPANDPRLFSQAYSGGKAGYWAVDTDGHLFRRLGWSFGWILIKTPENAQVVSLWVDGERGVFVVTADGVLYLTTEEKWDRVYPPALISNDEIVPDIRQLAVVEGRGLWALDASGAAYQGDGALPQAKWFDTSSPKLTSISANSPDSAWAANGADHSVWEYTAGRWESRGSGVVQVSVDTSGQAWGISTEGQIVMYAGSSWQTPPEFSDATGQHRPPDWGPLAWINARGTFLVVDRQGVAWAPSGIAVQGEDPWMPLG